MLHPSTKRLIDKLNDMTRKQRVAWTESDDGSVTHDTEGYRVILTPEPHAIFLTDALGRQIETCTPDEFADETDGNGRPYAKFVAELFREAHRHARGTEKAIRALLETLDAADTDIEAAPVPSVAPALTSVDSGEGSEDPIDETAPIEGEQAMAEAVASLAEQINNAAPPTAPMLDVAAEAVLADVAAEVALTEVATDVDLAEEVGARASAEPTPEGEEAVEAPPSPGTAYGGGFFGAYGGIGQYTGPSAETPVQEPAAEPALPPPEPEAAPNPAPRPAPVTGQRISLSSIPYGFGLGAVSSPAPSDGVVPAAQEPPAAAQPDPAATPAPAMRVIDGTVDLPDPVPEPDAGWVVRDAQPDDDADAQFPSPSLTDGQDTGAPDPDTPPSGPNPARRFNPWN